MAATSDGAIWYCETGDSSRNILVRFNPETKKMLSWPIPSGGGTVRHMDVWKGPAGEVSGWRKAASASSRASR